MAEERKGFFTLIQNNFVAVASIFVILMLLIPLPGSVLDLLMVLNLALSIVILLVVLYTPKASKFSSFPRVILFTTLFGLGINVSSTRLILTKGKDFDGHMVKAFASFVVGSSNDTAALVVGLVIFVILIVIQVLVITKGATRVSEVAARFSLDSMAQKNFAVDQELNSGAITEEEARAKRAEIRAESDFYSAMDGSSKFVSGNVKAGIFITVINLVAGLITGMAFRHEDLGTVFQTYSSLTIGDGLLSQLPSLLLSFATGLIVTGSNTDELLTDQVKREFSVSGNVFTICGALLLLLGIFGPFTGMPWYILAPLGALCIYVGFTMANRQKRQKINEEEAQAKAAGKMQTGGSPDDVSPVVPLDPLSLELGYALIPLVDEQHGAQLLERVKRIRREAALDLGLVVPNIRIIDNMILDPSEYSFKIRGIEAGKGKLKIGYYMAINTGDVTQEIKGEKTTEPTFGMPAVWIPEDKRADAEKAGYAVVDPPTVIATHITEIIRSHAAEILERQGVAQIINKIKDENEIVVNEVLDRAKFSYGQIQKVLQNLLSEQVSIRNIVHILETLANYGSQMNIWLLTEKVRETLGKQICLQYADEEHKLHVMNLSQNLAELLLEHEVIPSDGSMPYVALDPVDGRKWIKCVSDSFAAMQNNGFQPIVLCPAEVRQLVKSSTEREIPGLVVLSIQEMLAAGNSIELEVLGEIKQEAVEL